MRALGAVMVSAAERQGLAGITAQVFTVLATSAVLVIIGMLFVAAIRRRIQERQSSSAGVSPLPKADSSVEPVITPSSTPTGMGAA